MNKIILNSFSSSYFLLLFLLSMCSLPFKASSVSIKGVEDNFTCLEFSEHMKNCTPYQCQSPSGLASDPITVWQIEGKSGENCVVSFTLPITPEFAKSPAPPIFRCEYNNDAGQKLSNKIQAIHRGEAFGATRAIGSACSVCQYYPDVGRVMCVPAKIE
jgi:hypothetical protein